MPKTAVQIKAKLEATGIPYKQVECYGSQIVVTAWSEAAAQRWAFVIGRFARVRRVLQAIDYDKVNTGSMSNPSVHTVWRVFAAIGEA